MSVCYTVLDQPLLTARLTGYYGVVPQATMACFQPGSNHHASRAGGITYHSQGHRALCVNQPLGVPIKV